MSTVVRAARAADAAAIADVLVESRRVFLPYAPMAHPPHEVRAWIAETLVPGGHVHVADVSGSVVGFLAVSEGAGFSWVDQLYLLPGWVNRGVGTQLLDLAHALLPGPVRLYTFAQNDGARRFYERHGYRVVECSDGSANEEQCPDVLYERSEGCERSPSAR